MNTTTTTSAPREGWWRRWQRARAGLAPVFGMNRRNVELVYAHNQRRHYPLADDKILCKELLTAIGVPVAPTIAIGRGLFEVDAVLEQLRERENFVVKPASGSGGDGIVVIGERTAGGWATVKGREVATHEMRQHLANITFGCFSKEMEDRILIEERWRSGELVQPLAHVLRSSMGYYLVTLPARRGDKAIEAFRNWLLAEAIAPRTADA